MESSDIYPDGPEGEEPRNRGLGEDHETGCVGADVCARVMGVLGQAERASWIDMSEAEKEALVETCIAQEHRSVNWMAKRIVSECRTKEEIELVVGEVAEVLGKRYIDSVMEGDLRGMKECLTEWWAQKESLTPEEQAKAEGEQKDEYVGRIQAAVEEQQYIGRVMMSATPEVAMKTAVELYWGSGWDKSRFQVVTGQLATEMEARWPREGGKRGGVKYYKEQMKMWAEEGW